jgi:hypothetical protein
LFAIVGDEERANAFADRLRHKFHLLGDDVLVTRARNRGADLSR